MRGPAVRRARRWSASDCGLRRVSPPAWRSSLPAAGCGGGPGSTKTHTAASTPQTTGLTGPAVTHPAVETFPAGDNPHDLAVAGGKLWVADFGGPVREYDARGHHLKTRAPDARSMAPGPGSVWVGLVSDSRTGTPGPLVEIDAGRCQMVSRTGS